MNSVNSSHFPELFTLSIPEKNAKLEKNNIEQEQQQEPEKFSSQSPSANCATVA